MKRKLIKRCIFLIATIFIFGLAVLFIREYAPKQIEFESMNRSTMNANLAQGNYLLVSKNNGVKTFPVFWGESIYLYSIEQDRFYLIKTDKVPLQTFDDLISTVQGNRIFYTKGFASPGQEVFMKDFSRISREKKIVEAVDYAVTDDFIYYIAGEDEENALILRKEINTGKDTQIAKGMITYMIADEKNLYYYDEKKSTICKVEIDSGYTTTFRDVQSSPLWVGTEQTGKVIVVDEYGKLFRYEGKRKGERQNILKLKGPLSVYTNYKYAHPYFYYDNGNGQLYKVNLTTGTQQKIIQLSSVKGVKQSLNNGWEIYVNYCKNYIAIEVVYENTSTTQEGRQLLIFDYNGKLIKMDEL